MGGVGTSRLVKRVAITLVTVGLLLLSFVAYQLWGTALYEHSAQNRLRAELAGTLKHNPPTTLPSSTSAPPAVPTSAPPAVPSTQLAATTPDPPLNKPIGLLTIPRIGMSGAAIVEGTNENQLQQGPGHYQGTSLPGQAGNAAIAGHRTTYGAPFYDLNQLQVGDPIYIETAQGYFTYQVASSHVVEPSNTTVLEESEQPELTLTTCNPRYSAATRLVVVATLKSSVLPPSATATTAPPGASTTLPSRHLPKSLAGGAEAQQTTLTGISTGSEVDWAVVWGVLAAFAAVLGVVGWRRGRAPWRWVVLTMGTPVTIGALLICFQHVSLALPQTF
ncbi:MAG TPA: class E sortase [Acidimicrobiales bacterium]|nr:class E sortase [Acidimicrobiales bacterium]